MAELIKAQDIEKTPIEINDDFTVDTNVDRRYVVKSSCSITLDDLTVSGITITILCDFATSDTCTVSYTGPDGSMTDTLAGGSFVKYIWGTSSWISEKTVKVSGKDDSGNTFSYDMVCRDSNGVNFDPYSRHTYSTQETWTGDYWIDGKKIYRKVYDFITPSTTGSSVSINHNITNLYEVLSLQGFINFYSSGNFNGGMPINYYYSTSNYSCCWFGSGNWFNCMVGNSILCNQQARIILEYTKSSD